MFDKCTFARDVDENNDDFDKNVTGYHEVNKNYYHRVCKWPQKIDDIKISLRAL